MTPYDTTNGSPSYLLTVKCLLARSSVGCFLRRLRLLFLRELFGESSDWLPCDVCWKEKRGASSNKCNLCSLKHLTKFIGLTADNLPTYVAPTYPLLSFSPHTLKSTLCLGSFSLLSSLSPPSPHFPSPPSLRPSSPPLFKHLIVCAKCTSLPPSLPPSTFDLPAPKAAPSQSKKEE